MISYCGFDYIGLSINSSVLRAVVVDARKKKIVALSEKKADRRMLDGGTFIEAGIFKDTLRQLMEKQIKKPKCICVTLPERYALTRQLSFPNLSNEEIAEAVNWQARNIFPLPFDDMYVDWKIVDSSDRGKEVLVVALPKRLVDDLVAILSQLGFRPVNIQTSASSLGRLIPNNNKQLRILVNVTSDGAAATLVEGRVTKMTATSSFDLASQKDIITKTIKITKKLQEFYLVKNKDKGSIKKIWLTGGLAGDTLKSTLSEELNILTEYLQLPISLSDQKKNLIFAEAIAVALVPIEPPESTQTINLLPPTIQKYYESSINLRKVKYWTRAILSVLFFALLLSILSYAYLFYKAHTLSAYTAKSGAVDIDYKISEQVIESDSETKLRKMNLQIDKFLNLVSQKKTPKTLISSLPLLIPQGITISSWQYNKIGKQIILEGRTKSRETLLNFQQSLEEVEDFSKVTIPLENLEKKADYNFTLTIKLKIN